METAVFEVHLVIAGRLDVVSVHLQETPTKVNPDRSEPSGCHAGRVHSPSLPCFFCLYRPAALK